MSDLEHVAIERLKAASEMSLQYYKQPLVICISGGKDSSVFTELAIRAGIPAAERLPKAKDADKYDRVLVMELGMMSLVNYRGPINYPDKFPYWMPLPPAPEDMK